MPKNFDINALSVGDRGILDSNKPSKKHIKDQTKTDRRHKDPKEKAIKKILVSLTEDEYKNLQKIAGRVPLATWIKVRLEELGDI